MSSRRTVHIPIVQPGARSLAGDAGEDRLIEVYTQHYAFDPLTKQEEQASREVDAKARDKDWDRVAAPLRKVGLYQAGCAAASAVRKLGIRQPLTALYQRISRLAWIEGQRLQSAGARGPSEGRSAELGLALVLLMCASGSRHRQVIATGALGGQPRGMVEDDVEVLPVGSLPEKLRLVSTLARHGGGLPGVGTGSEVLFFTPRRFEQDGVWMEVASLPEVAQLKERGVRVVPVERLSEAAAELKALRARHLFHDHVASATIALLLVVMLTGYAWSMVRERPIPMTFLPAVATLDPEPYQACFTKDGGFYPVPLAREGLTRSIPVGETLGWRVRVGEPAESGSMLASWFAPDYYYVAQVMVSERSRAKIIVPQLAGSDVVTVPPGGIWEWGWQLNDEVENNGLVLLARPEEPFDPEVLRATLVGAFPPAAGEPADGALDVTAATNFIASKAPGAATFIIQTVERSERCNP